MGPGAWLSSLGRRVLGRASGCASGRLDLFVTPQGASGSRDEDAKGAVSFLGVEESVHGGRRGVGATQPVGGRCLAGAEGGWGLRCILHGRAKKTYLEGDEWGMLGFFA